MKDLARDKLKETVNLQDIIKTDNLRNKSKSRKVEYSLSIVFSEIYMKDNYH